MNTRHHHHHHYRLVFCFFQLGLWNPSSYRRSTSLGNSHHSKVSRLNSDETLSKNNRTKTTSPANTDSSSEISDEGYRTGLGMGDTKNEELDERPDSSCTQVSQTSSLESGVSSGGALDDSDPPPPTTTSNYKPDQIETTIISHTSSGNNSNSKYHQYSPGSKIPLLGSLRALGKGGSSFHYSTESNSSSRKSSIDSDRPLLSATSHSFSGPAGFRRDAFGRHSLRIRSTTNDYDKYNATRTAIDPTTSTTDQSSVSKNTMTWSGRNRRQRPTIQPELTFRNRNPVGVTATSPSTGTASYRSRSVNSGTSRGQARASSTSPSSRRRNVFIGSSSGYGAPLSPEIKPIPTLKLSLSKSTCVKSTPTSPQPAATSESAKISPLLRNMLKDVELDNDASILKKMEEIVNQYKARVESILAAEGKTLNDDFTAKVDSNNVTSQPNEDEIRKFKPTSSLGSCQLSRRNSLDSSLSHHMPTTRMYPSPRKDIASQSPSKIPMPRFYRPKETCL